MEKYSELERALVLDILKASESTAPVEVSFGFVEDSRCYKGICIKKAPHKVIKMIMDTENAIVTLSDGMLKVSVLGGK